VHHAKGESLDRLLALTAPKPDWRALDVATGGGHTALALAPHVREVIATDLTRPMLDAARAFIASKGVANVVFQEADAMSLPFGDAAFDLVTCRIAPHHFPDVPRFVREMFRVLRPGGIAVVIDNVVPEDSTAAGFINEFETIRDPSHHWSHPESDWRSFFSAAGFQDLHVEPFRKARDYVLWLDTMSVAEPERAKLRVMLNTAPASAKTALAPEERDGKLWFHLDEILILGRKPGT